MNFWSYSFSYIFKGYQNYGEKHSAHIYALCIMTVLLSCNFLSIFFIVLSDNYLKSEAFKELTIALFASLFAMNAFYFLRAKNYLRMATEYREMSSNSKATKKIAFWVYFSATIILLAVTLVYRE